MADLDVVAVIKAKAGSEQVVQEALEALVGPTRSEEGCISYELFSSRVDSATFITVEKWRGQGDLDAHLQTPHLAQALAAAGEHLAGAPEIHPLAPLGG